MSRTERPPLAWVALGLLGVLVVINATFLVMVRTGGPLIGGAFYGVLLALGWRGRRRDYRAAMVGGLVGLAVHTAEVVTAGWSACPVLLALNLILPAALAPVAWLAGQRARQ